MYRLNLPVIFLFWLAIPYFSIAQNVNIGVLDFQQPSLEAYEKGPKGILGLDISTGGMTAAETRKLNDKLVLDQARAYVIEELTKDNRFVLVERSNLNLITNEKEFQKSEAFLDGYVVEQGKNIGADFLVSGKMLLGKKKISISIFSVKDQVTVASAIVSSKVKLISGSKLQSDIKTAVQEMKNNFLPSLIQVVRPLKSGKTTKKLLIAGGLSNNLKEKQSLSIYYFNEEEFNGKKLIREITVGKGKIADIEGNDFSVLSVKKGGAEIKELLDSGKTLYCKKQ